MADRKSPAGCVTGTSHLVAGLAMPEVALASTGGGTVDFSLLAGSAIVFVYPYSGRPGVADPPGWDDLPGAHGSTPEAAGFRDHYAQFQSEGFDVFGVSGQTTAWQREFANRMSLPFELLSDDAFAFADDLALPRFTTGGIAYLGRMTLIVRDGVLVRAIHPIADPAGHALAVLASLREQG